MTVEPKTTDQCDVLLKNLVRSTIVGRNEDETRVGKHLAEDKKNYNISLKVLERLLLRHSILRNIEEVEADYAASRAYHPRSKVGQEMNAARDDGSEKQPIYKTLSEQNNPASDEEPKSNRYSKEDSSNVIDESLSDEQIASEKALRSYRLATTDLFVEKPIAYLEDDYNHYIFIGKLLFILGIFSIFLGISSSFTVTLPTVSAAFLESVGLTKFAAALDSFKPTTSWLEFSATFVKSFTFFGFLVTLTVYCFRLGKAMTDQAERLRERRHSLRQGRLFIHLNDGRVNIDELEKAFDWNVSKGNAFANIPTEASAPWGAVIKEAIKAVPEIAKNLKAAAK